MHEGLDTGEKGISAIGCIEDECDAEVDSDDSVPESCVMCNVRLAGDMSRFQEYGRVECSPVN